MACLQSMSHHLKSLALMQVLLAITRYTFHALRTQLGSPTKSALIYPSAILEKSKDFLRRRLGYRTPVAPPLRGSLATGVRRIMH